jgi:hypothetical protein
LSIRLSRPPGGFLLSGQNNMTLQIIKPYIHVEDANGNPYVGAKLYVYVPGTTTPAAIYADAALSVPLPNPLSGATGSDAAGNFPRAYIAAGAYKLRAETAAGVLIWQEDNIDTGLSAGAGALPIASGGTGGITAAAARTNLDVPSNSELAALASDITGIRATLQSLASSPQGRLSLSSGTPVLAVGVTASTSVYYTPATGNLIPIYDGSQITAQTFAELTLALNSNHVASNIYDVFVFMNAGSVRIGTGPAWNTATAGAGTRGTGAGTTELSRTVGGFHTNANPATMRNGATTYAVNVNCATYVGSIFIDGTNGQVSCLTTYGQSRKWGVWNAYNRVPITLKAGDATTSWAYTSAAVRPSNGSTANSLQVLAGLAEEAFDLDFQQNILVNSATSTDSVLIGYNSTAAGTGKIGLITTGGSGVQAQAEARYFAPPALGVQTITALEANPTVNTGSPPTFFGTEAYMVLSATWRG